MRDILKSELIGSEIKIIEAKNKANIGIEGKIIDETKNMLTIETKRGLKRLIKSGVKIRLIREKTSVNGELLVGRPEDRIKKRA